VQGSFLLRESGFRSLTISEVIYSRFFFCQSTFGVLFLLFSSTKKIFPSPLPHTEKTLSPRPIFDGQFSSMTKVVSMFPNQTKNPCYPGVIENLPALHSKLKREILADLVLIIGGMIESRKPGTGKGAKVIPLISAKDSPKGK
jgi:hypothetical protein